MSAAHAGADSIRLVVTENDAERVADGIDEDPESRFACARDTGSAQSEQFLFGLVGVAHPDVQMHLLG